MKTEYDYQKEIEIDPDALDVEWLGQPSLFMKYSEACALARKKMDRAKEHLEVTRAELDKEIRSDPEKFEVAKVTESAISSAITVHSTFRNASALFIEAKYEFDVLSRAVQAFEQRKTALENLVRLNGQGYFASPKEPRDLGMEWQKKAATGVSNQKVKRGMRRRASR